jgi:hypothetical protein
MFRFDPQRMLVQNYMNYWDQISNKRCAYQVVTDLTLYMSDERQKQGEEVPTELVVNP